MRTVLVREDGRTSRDRTTAAPFWWVVGIMLTSSAGMLWILRKTDWL
jgi:hypothetical protein